MADMFPPSLVEMITELERDLLAKRRSWHAKEATGRLWRKETTARRLQIAEAVLALLRAQADPTTLAALAHLEEQKRVRLERRKAFREARRAAASPSQLATPPVP